MFAGHLSLLAVPAVEIPPVRFVAGELVAEFVMVVLGLLAVKEVETFALLGESAQGQVETIVLLELVVFSVLFVAFYDIVIGAACLLHDEGLVEMVVVVFEPVIGCLTFIDIEIQLRRTDDCYTRMGVAL